MQNEETLKMPTVIDNIKTLYNQLHKKTVFIEVVATEVNRAPKSLKNHWFGEFWSIPEEFQPKVVELLQKTILEQNTKITA